MDDPLTMYPRLGSYVATSGNPLALCDIGHQGLPHDRESGLLYNRMRYYSPTLARFTSRDPLMYVDGMSMYEYVGSNSVNYLDSLGLSVTVTIKTCINGRPLNQAEWDEQWERIHAMIDDEYPLSIIRLNNGDLLSHSVVSVLGPDGNYHVLDPMPHGFGIGKGDYTYSSQDDLRPEKEAGYMASGEANVFIRRTTISGDKARDLIALMQNAHGNNWITVDGIFDCRHACNLFYEYAKGGSMVKGITNSIIQKIFGDSILFGTKYDIWTPKE